MHAAVRPYATAGVALVGASVIAVTPIAPPLTDVHIHNPVTHLAALANPFQAYAQVFGDAVTNLQAILTTASANPTPILTKVLSNQFATLQALLASLPATAGGVFTAPTTTALANPTTSLSQILPSLAGQPGAVQPLLAAIQTALGDVFTALTTTVPPLLQGASGDLASANVEGAINNVLLAGLTALFPLALLLGPTTAAIAQPLQNLVTAITNTLGPTGAILANPLQNLVNVLNIPTNNALGTELAFAGLIGPLIEGPAATGAAIQGVINAINGVAGSPSVLQAVIDAPAVIAGGVLNGGFGPDVGPLVNPFPGITLSAFFGGLLNQAALSFTPTGGINLQLPGAIPGLQQLQQLIAAALTPPTTAAAMAAPLQLAKAPASNAPSALPNLAATSVTVPTKQTPKTGLRNPTGDTSANGSPAAKPTGTGTTTGGTDLTNGNKVTPGSTGSSAQTGQGLNGAVQGAGDQAANSFQTFGDTIKKLTGNGAKAASSSDSGTASAGAASGGGGRHRK